MIDQIWLRQLSDLSAIVPFLYTRQNAFDFFETTGAAASHTHEQRGLAKKLMGEVDVFQIDSTHELYSHMNVNYVKLRSLPAFDDYSKLLGALQSGDFFTTTGEVLLPDVRIDEETAGRIAVQARILHTFPLEMAEIVWGDGKLTYKTIPLSETHPFGDFTFRGNAEGDDWTWARLAVWDVAGNGAFVNPVRRGKTRRADR